MIAEQQTKDRYSRKEVTDIIRSVLGKIDQYQEPTAKLFNELTKLEEYIESMRSELAALRSIEISHNHIPAASDELDAVVEETAKATGSIMDACEKIEKASSSLDDDKRYDISNAVTAIYEACSFQDITGQRISKVVRTLKSIENKVHEIVKALDRDGISEPEPKETKTDLPEGKRLAHGPQLPGGGASQAEIDALLASFG